VVAVHSGVLREAIHQFKYRPRRELAEPLGQMLCDHWRRVCLPVDLVMPVPLHPTRQKERGFNQARLLASVFCAHSELPLNAVDLIRERATAPQVGLGAREREANVSGAFSYAGHALTGVRVLLIDDVCTSGATLEACAQAIYQGRPESVWALTLARPVD
jgi:ComF family protein